MSLLANVSTGKINKPPLVAIYGGEGIGKSTFAAGYEANGEKSVHNLNPIVIDAEDSTGSLDVARLTADKFPHHRKLIETIGELLKSDHPYRALVIDSTDWLQAIVFNDIASAAGKSSVADIPYGNGYAEAESIMRHLLIGLKKLRDEKNMAIILVCHSTIKRFDDPVNESYDRYALKLQDGKSTSIAALVYEWSEVLLFATQEVFIENKEKRFNRTVNKGRGGDRIMYTVEQPAFRAKNRFNLPEQLPLSWDAFVTAMKG